MGAIEAHVNLKKKEATKIFRNNIACNRSVCHLVAIGKNLNLLFYSKTKYCMSCPLHSAELFLKLLRLEQQNEIVMTKCTLKKLKSLQLVKQ